MLMTTRPCQVLSWAFYGASMALVIEGGLGKPLAVVLAEGGKDKIRYNYRVSCCLR